MLILTLCSQASTAQWILSSRTSDTYLSPILATALSTTVAICLAVKASGAYLNPAFTIGFAIFQGRPLWHLVPGYIIAQFLGAFSASAVVYGIYFDNMNAFDGGHRSVIGTNATAIIFATYPKPYMTTLSSFFEVSVGSSVFMAVVYAITDRNNVDYPPHVIALLIGLMSLLIGLCLGWNTGYPLNPAKDFGSRLFSCIFYGSQVFSAYNYYFWIPLAAPFVGMIIGATLYKSLIGYYLELKDSKSGQQVSIPISKGESTMPL